jgi:hypothetical protein
MAQKLTTAELLAKIQQTATDAATFKALWQDYFPPDLSLPPDYEIKNAVRRLVMADLVEGMTSYASKLAQEGKDVKRAPSTKNAMNYICGTAWKIVEKENPSQKFHPTARRQRNAQKDPDSPQWDGEAFGNASPEERQKIMAEIIAGQKARGVQ